ncbi:Nramp family divalent metal transporter [Bacillus sp. JJ1562]|uniref:Nramp family divalent metal transporter n=1 Tax=Bacillus sp. JJ1562 TaxID=3122960 RepID=UPI003002A164
MSNFENNNLPLNSGTSAQTNVQQKGLVSKLKWVGPGLIVASAAVGSGEIINATRLGAIAGFAVLWVLVWGIFLKGFIQQEIGRYTLMTKKTITEGFADIPGPKIKGKSWFLWVFLILLALVVLVIIAGIGGAVGGTLHVLFPAISASTWGVIANICYLPILLSGIFLPKLNVYAVVEKIMMLIVIGLTLFMVYIAFIAIPQSEQFSYSIVDLFKGMTFSLPEGSVLISLAVLGSVGAGIELIYYSTWILSKGYVNNAHIEDSNEAKKHERIKFWFSVLKLDTWIGTTVTFIVTLAFFITGTVVLGAAGEVPDGVNVVEKISVVFTDVLGPGYFVVFMIGALAGLATTALGIADGTARMVIDLRNEFTKKETTTTSFNKLYTVSVVAVIFAWIIFYMFISAPTFLITIGTAALSLMFPLYGVALLYLNRQVPEQYRMHWIIKVILVICFILFTSLWFVGELF